jgi:hypothetical protein
VTEDGQSLGGNLNPGSPEYEADELHIRSGGPV